MSFHGVGLMFLVGVFWLQIGQAQTSVEARTKPIADLPENVKFEDGKFSIFVSEEKHEKESMFLIYVINATEKEIELPAQDGDIYLKQEAKIGGEWKRTQPHRYSWCGNSYYSVKLAAQSYVIYPDLYRGWAPPVEGRPKDEMKKFTVRYRIHNGSKDEIVTNEIEKEVSLRLLEIASTDAMAIPHLKTSELVAIADGSKKVEAIDHISIRNKAIQELGTRRGDEEVIKVLMDLTNHLPATNSETQRPDYIYLRALESLVNAASGERAFRILKSKLSNESLPHESILWVITQRVRGVKAEKISLLDSYLQSFDNPLYKSALDLRSGLWSPEESEAELKKIFQNDATPPEFQKHAREIYWKLHPNEVLNLRFEKSRMIGSYDVTLENISSDPISFSYSHFSDVVFPNISVGWEGPKLPLRNDFKKIVDAERHEKTTKTLTPGQIIRFTDINVWRYHHIPEELPDDFRLQFLTQLKEFGDVPAGVGFTSSIRTSEDRFGAPWVDARNEQKAENTK